MADTRWLEKRGAGYYAVKDVPRDLRGVLGKKRLVRSLGTRDLTVARARRHVVLAEFEREIAEARTKAPLSGPMKAALEWRAILSAAPPDGRAEHHEFIADEAEDLEDREGPAVARQFFDMATGKATPLLHYVDPWLAEGGAKGPVTLRTQRQYRADLAEFSDWLCRSHPGTVEAVTPKVAGSYVTGLVATQTHRKTANRKISALSAYWRWMTKRAGIAANPWQGQSLAKRLRDERPEDRKRPVTDAELATLLGGPADPELADLIRLGALTGMRIEELYRLEVADCAGGWFNIRRAKTRAGIRRVPTHSDLEAIVRRRTAGKGPADYLLHEPGAARPGLDRGMAASKRFGHYRKRLGVHETIAGHRHSRVDFHSLRRWFITKARAGFDQAVVAAIVGHEVGNLTDDTYSGGPDDEMRRRCVESVKLPPVGPVAANTASAEGAG